MSFNAGNGEVEGSRKATLALLHLLRLSGKEVQTSCGCSKVDATIGVSEFQSHQWDVSTASFCVFSTANRPTILTQCTMISRSLPPHLHLYEPIAARVASFSPSTVRASLPQSSAPLGPARYWSHSQRIISSFWLCLYSTPQSLATPVP